SAPSVLLIVVYTMLPTPSTRGRRRTPQCGMWVEDDGGGGGGGGVFSVVPVNQCDTDMVGFEPFLESDDGAGLLLRSSRCLGTLQYCEARALLEREIGWTLHCGAEGLIVGIDTATTDTYRSEASRLSFVLSGCLRCQTLVEVPEWLSVGVSGWHYYQALLECGLMLQCCLVLDDCGDESTEELLESCRRWEVETVGMVLLPKHGVEGLGPIRRSMLIYMLSRGVRAAARTLDDLGGLLGLAEETSMKRRDI